jgi:CBS domain containing-hemolysin-like protein
VLRELFDFGDLIAGQVAVPRVRTTAIRAGASPDTLAETLQQALHARYPVYERDPDQIIGYVHVKDILRLLMEGHALSAEEVRPVAFVPETLDLEDVLEAIHEAGSQLAVVMDEQGGTAGVITIEDLCAEVLGETEEIGGKTLQWSREDDGRLRVAGTLRLEELGELLARDLLHGDVETVSGLVLHLLGRVPRAGDTVTWHGVRFEVASMIGRGVGECVIVPGESVVD